MEISGKIRGLHYKVILFEDLKEIDLKQFNINEAPSASLLKDNKYTFAISK